MTSPRCSSARSLPARARVRTGAVAVVACLGLALAGCSSSGNDSLAQQANAGGEKAVGAYEAPCARAGLSEKLKYMFAIVQMTLS